MAPTTTQHTRRITTAPKPQPHLDALLDLIAHARTIDLQPYADAPKVLGRDPETGTPVLFTLHDDKSAYASFGSHSDICEAGSATAPVHFRGVGLRASAQVALDPGAGLWKLTSGGYSLGTVHRWARPNEGFGLPDPTPLMKADALAVIQRAADASLFPGLTLDAARIAGAKRDLARHATTVLRALDHADSQSYGKAGDYLEALRAVASDLDGA